MADGDVEVHQRLVDGDVSPGQKWCNLRLARVGSVHVLAAQLVQPGTTSSGKAVIQVLAARPRACVRRGPRRRDARPPRRLPAPPGGQTRMRCGRHGRALPSGSGRAQEPAERRDDEIVVLALGSPETATVPTTPVPLRMRGKAPPCAAKSAAGRRESISKVLPWSANDADIQRGWLSGQRRRTCAATSRRCRRSLLAGR